MPYKKKFHKGKQITSLDELMKQKWIMWGERPKNIGFVGSMQIRTVERLMNLGYFTYAIDVREVVE